MNFLPKTDRIIGNLDFTVNCFFQNFVAALLTTFVLVYNSTNMKFEFITKISNRNCISKNSNVIKFLLKQ